MTFRPASRAGLRAALDLLGRDPDLARLLTVDHCSGGEDVPAALDAERRWLRRFADLLAETVADDPRPSPAPALREAFLISGVRCLIGQMVADGDASDLPRLLPDRSRSFSPTTSSRARRPALHAPLSPVDAA